MGNYVSSIFGKLQVADRAEAIIRAREDIQCHSDAVEPVHLQRMKDDLGLTAEEAAESVIWAIERLRSRCRRSEPPTGTVHACVIVF